MLDTTVILGVMMFTVTVLSLVMVILFARSQLVSSGDVTIEINGDADKSVRVPAGGKLLGTLASKGIFPGQCLWWRWYLCSMSMPDTGRWR